MFLPTEALMTVFAENQRTTSVHSACSKCGTPLWLTRIEPDKPGFARRSLECPRCENQTSEIVELGPDLVVVT
jgi:hypothetical protein